MPWDPAHRVLVLEMWPTGCGSSAIIAALAEAGKTAGKSAVIGIAFRAGLAFQGAHYSDAGRANAKAKKPTLTPHERAERERARDAKRRARAAAAAGRPVPPPRPRVAPEGVPVTLGILLTDVRDGQCRYIADDPRAGPATCCGHATVPGSSWCPGHRAICSAPAAKPVSVWVQHRRVA